MDWARSTQVGGSRAATPQSVVDRATRASRLAAPSSRSSGGGAVLLGDPYAADLTLGFESIQVFGTRGYSRFEAHALPWFVVAPMIEVTSMPHGSTVGVRLLLDLGFDLGKGFSMVVRGGYQARSFASGGPAVGGTFSYAF
jgi:hypothetical protein